MNYEERKKWFCQQCGWPHLCGYVNRHLEDKCTALQEKMEGWELGYQDAIDNPTGGELLHVLEKGRKIGYKDAVEKAYAYLEKKLDTMWSITPDGEFYLLPTCLDDFKKYMEGQQ